jgi:acetyl esterase
MPLDPQIQAARARRAQAGTPPLYALSLAEARAADLADIRASAGEPEPVRSVVDDHIAGPAGPLPVRIYHPAAAGDPPVLVYFFGGGWTLGSLDTGDAVCRSLTNAVGCVTVAAGYRLAPEHPFPAAVEDCFAAVRWAADNAAGLHADPRRIAVGGDSAGGNLAAAITLLTRDWGGPALRHQLLVYPNTDYRADTASMRENDDPLLFNRRSVDWYWGHYLASPEDGADQLASPLRAEDLSGLPEATVITAEYDPLRDEGELYAQRMRDAGVAVETRRYEGMAHGFFTMTGTLQQAREAHAYAAARLRAALASTADTGTGTGAGQRVR